MKNLVLLLLLAALSLASCQRKCWTCKIVQTMPEGIVYQTTRFEQVCGKTAPQIRLYEQQQTFVAPRTVGDTAYWQETTCH